MRDRRWSRRRARARAPMVRSASALAPARGPAPGHRSEIRIHRRAGRCGTGVRAIEAEVLTRPGRYKEVADNLQVKEVWVGDGERRKRYVLCLNPQEAERERARREQLLIELDAELALLEQREDDHPKAACALMASRRYGRYLSADWRGRPNLDTAKVKAAGKFDGKFVVITNDDTLSAEDIALGYKGAWIIK